ncbi:hypothetical protein ACFSSA_10360 [Luteolibacter algae]|uniref:Uncharacterized protein n=1 Tax=Luteolibacter algae TaxID=454151 RepID=A0ABW5D8J7_9BACT
MKSIFWLVYIALIFPALANDPGTAALEFLEKVKSGEVDLSPGTDTALQAHTSQTKLKSIGKRLEQLRKDLAKGSLEVGEIREDADFAAAIVRKTGGFDSSHLQVFPVALIKSGERWLPAPVLASYENAVPAYTVSLRRRLESLESWMMKERVASLEKLLADFSQRTRKQIEKSIRGNDLENDDLEQLTEKFLDACLKGDQGAILGYLGGLSDPLPEDWAARLQATEVVANSDVSRDSPWRLLVSEEVVRVIVHARRGGESGLVSVACLDPAKAGARGTMGKIVLLHFDFSKNAAGQWVMELPRSLLNNDEEELIYDDQLDVDLLDRFTSKLRERSGLLASSSAQEACRAVISGLKGGGLEQVLRSVDFSGAPKDARYAAAEAAEIWWSLNQPGTLRVPVELGFQQEGNLAIAVYQWFSIKQADQFERKTLYFKKTAEGWVWATGPVGKDEKRSRELLSKWMRSHEEQWRIKWREILLKPSQRLDTLDFDNLANDSQVRAIVERWVAALDEVDLMAALACSAWLGEIDAIPMKTLRNLSYELDSSSEAQFSIENIYRSNSWVAASLKKISDDKVSHAFIPVVITPSGPRILPEIDLLADDSRTRNFLNNASFRQLENFAPQEKIDELRVLFELFQKEVSGKPD